MVYQPDETVHRQYEALYQKYLKIGAAVMSMP